MVVQLILGFQKHHSMDSLGMIVEKLLLGICHHRLVFVELVHSIVVQEQRSTVVVVEPIVVVEEPIVEVVVHSIVVEEHSIVVEVEVVPIGSIVFEEQHYGERHYHKLGSCLKIEISN